MGRFFIDAEIVKIDFPDGEWVEVKEELTQADQDYIISKLANVERIDKDTKLELSLGKLALLERSIKRWSFKENGLDILISKDTISRLREKYRAVILPKLDEIYSKSAEWAIKN